MQAKLKLFGTLGALERAPAPASRGVRAAAPLGPHAEAGQRPLVHAQWDPPASNRYPGPLPLRHAPRARGPTASTVVARPMASPPYSVHARRHAVPIPRTCRRLDAVCTAFPLAAHKKALHGRACEPALFH
jgi:hypothetical protein